MKNNFKLINYNLNGARTGARAGGLVTKLSNKLNADALKNNDNNIDRNTICIHSPHKNKNSIDRKPKFAMSLRNYSPRKKNGME